MQTVANVRVVRQDGEYIVRAYDEENSRLPDCDYFTDDKQDAVYTAFCQKYGLAESVDCVDDAIGVARYASIVLAGDKGIANRIEAINIVGCLACSGFDVVADNGCRFRFIQR